MPANNKASDNLSSPFRGTRGIIPLSEGTFTIDKTKLFIPFDESMDLLQARSAGSLLVEIQPFVVVTSRDLLLLDAGLGFSKSGSMQIHQNLVNTGINPSEITKVLLTHLHKDHAGGVSRGAELSFPNATYYVQERELNLAFEKGMPSFIPGELAVLKASSQVVLLKDDSGIIDDYIFYQVTGAHSPYHQVFWIKEEGKIIFFGGDDAPQLQQMKHRFVAKYDFDGKKAMELRRQWWEQGQKEKWTFLFYHDTKTPIYDAN
ncbi:MAG: MBL fold metallo-hydrolase [Bacteroidota bacterium]|nr:MBL fold metallo-hydrolase [Bacteroidota bacterium]